MNDWKKHGRKNAECAPNGVGNWEPLLWVTVVTELHYVVCISNIWKNSFFCVKKNPHGMSTLNNHGKFYRLRLNWMVYYCMHLHSHQLTESRFCAKKKNLSNPTQHNNVFLLDSSNIQRYTCTMDMMKKNSWIFPFWCIRKMKRKTNAKRLLYFDHKANTHNAWQIFSLSVHFSLNLDLCICIDKSKWLQFIVCSICLLFACVFVYFPLFKTHVYQVPHRFTARTSFYERGSRFLQ